MDTNKDTSSLLKMRLIVHIAGLLDDLEMTDSNQKDYSDRAIVEMHERNIDLAGFIVNSLGISDTVIDEQTFVTKLNLVEPQKYVDQYL